MKEKIITFCKKEIVLVVATVLAVASAFVVPPSEAYWKYIDWRVLGILLSLMVVMAGLQQNGLFDTLGEALLARTKKVGQLILVLVMLCFFMSMAITNDVALITFVPFAVLTLEKSNQQRLLIPVIVLQTVAANLGSMLTPIGNPQNLYLYNLSGMGIGEFVMVMLPYTMISFLLLLVSMLFIKGKRQPVEIAAAHTDLPKEEAGRRKRGYYNAVYMILFVLAFCVVLKLLPFEPVLIVTLLMTFAMQKTVLKQVDYCLLLTFVSFFIFTGNIGNIPVVRDALQDLVAGREILVGIASSQVISNVPAALMLSGFTGDYKGLLAGVNIGGLGTLIASMASLISYKIFANKCSNQKGKYFAIFTLVNVLYLVVLFLSTFLF